MFYIVTLGSSPTLMFFLGATGLGAGCNISKGGGIFAPSTNSPVEVADGWYSLLLSNGETDTPGPLAFHFGAGTFTDFLAQVAPAVNANVEWWGTQSVPAMVAGNVPTQTVAMTDGVIAAAKINANVVPFLFSTTALAESYAADGATGTIAQLLYALLSAVTEFSIAGPTMTCKRLDGTTAAMTFTLAPSLNPTSRSRAS